MAKLSPQAARLRTIIVTVPLIVVSSVILFKRQVLGEPQRELPRNLFNKDDKPVEGTLMKPSDQPPSTPSKYDQ